MKLKLINIESKHNKTAGAIGNIYNDIKINDTSLTLFNECEYLRTSDIKEIIIKTENSVYTLERIEEK